MDVAWVTGGGTGIGLALCQGLAARGYSLVLSGRREAPLVKAAADLTEQYPNQRFIPILGDVVEPLTAERVLQAARPIGPIALLVNNAGSNTPHPFNQTPAQEFLEAFETNCLGAIRCTKAVLPEMQKTGRGAIVNISSVLGKFASGGSASYSVSKYALTGFTDVLRQHLLDSPVHVLGVYPGFIRTAMTQPFVREGSLRARMGKTPEQMARAILRALDRKKTELHFPWYVPLALALHHGFPRLAASLAKRSRE